MFQTFSTDDRVEKATLTLTFIELRNNYERVYTFQQTNMEKYISNPIKKIQFRNS
jgi:hypothetical protein